MRTTTILFVMALVLTGCSSVKRNQKFLAQGNYDQAIFLAVKKIKKNKPSSRNDQHIFLLEEAYKKVVDQDKDRIKFLEKDGNASNSKEIYFRYLDLEDRQRKIRPLLPLTDSKGHTARFDLEDYSSQIITAKANYVDYSYKEAAQYMNQFLLYIHQETSFG